jgi:predicted transcriptional regulator
MNSLELFKTVALSGGNSIGLARRLDLSRKQYYSKMSRLIKNGLIKKYHGNFCLTIFGITIYEVIEELRIISDRSLTIKTHNLSQNLSSSHLLMRSETSTNRRNRDNNQAINLELLTVPPTG